MLFHSRPASDSRGLCGHRVGDLVCKAGEVSLAQQDESYSTLNHTKFQKLNFFLRFLFSTLNSADIFTPAPYLSGGDTASEQFLQY